MDSVQLSRKLNYWYYTMMCLAVIGMVVSYKLLIDGVIQIIDAQSRAGIIIQYVVIFDALITIPLGLYGFKIKCNQIRKIEDTEARSRNYLQWARWRIVLVSNSMITGIVAFYLLGSYRSMLFVAAIGAIGWYFTKPTARKIEIELNSDTNQENY